jgi:hypothetical protein
MTKKSELEQLESLTLEVREDEQSDKVLDAAASSVVTGGTTTVMITPPLDEDYWLFRVKVSDKQAIVGFPKFFTIGIGFQHEDFDWNTNLPYQANAEEILAHIWKNARRKRQRKADTPLRSVCLKAIQLIQDAAKRCRETGVLDIS